MKRLAAFSAILTLGWPGVYDSFGKKAMYVAAPFIVVGLYMMLPAN
jgi:hypothetical protein